MQAERLEALVQGLKTAGIAQHLVSDPSSIAYLIGYETQPGERLLLLKVAADGRHQLYLNQLFPQASDLADDLEIVTYRDGEPVISCLAQSLAPGKTGIDKVWPSHFLLDLMATRQDLHPVNAAYLVDDLRAIKSPEEQELMREASALNDQATLALINLVADGLPESEMVSELAGIYQRLGCQGFSFEPIIAYGANGADPHHETNDDRPQPGDSVVIDIGSSYKGYCSDMTRTVFYGEPDEESRRVYETVRQAQEVAIKAVRPGVTLASIDRAARQVIEEAGYGEYFTHRTGHFIGREVHEAGDVSEFNQAKAQVGQIFSIEPGIYLPGKVGVRIEDLVLVTETGCQVLNQVSKDLIVVEPHLKF
ncbi:Xaa-Pro peptidase family protein [Abiotrophia sp.]|uniref:M24 family metallopeptidase n=1 Tax=Abiotrophia sp. TaxID=76631 RepID=UPI001CAFE871|nr:aminopeptidase P family protein [Abiotrophia sp.]MBF0936945.1 aminopeptidase P family protein [Abiotrophia sp.]